MIDPVRGTRESRQTIIWPFAVVSVELRDTRPSPSAYNIWIWKKESQAFYLFFILFFIFHTIRFVQVKIPSSFDQTQIRWKSSFSFIAFDYNLLGVQVSIHFTFHHYTPIAHISFTFNRRKNITMKEKLELLCLSSRVAFQEKMREKLFSTVYHDVFSCIGGDAIFFSHNVMNWQKQRMLIFWSAIRGSHRFVSLSV